MKKLFTILGITAALGFIAGAIAPQLGCGPGIPIPAVAHQLERRAAELCISGPEAHDVELCARKCAEPPPPPASSGE